MDTARRHRGHGRDVRGTRDFCPRALAVVGFLAFLVLAVPVPLRGADVRAEAAFHELEDKLLLQKSLRFKFSIASDGPVGISLRGQVRLRSGNRAEIEFTGTFQSKPVNTRFESDGKTMRWTAGEQKFELPTPTALNEAIVIGLTRMGLLQNILALLAGAPPEHADGTVQDWVRVSDFFFAAPDPATKLRGRSIQFGITVADKDVGIASCWISPLTRLPVERRQTVHFPAGDVRIVETYEFPE